jgi:hypothetical protein
VSLYHMIVLLMFTSFLGLVKFPPQVAFDFGVVSRAVDRNVL